MISAFRLATGFAIFFLLGFIWLNDYIRLEETGFLDDPSMKWLMLGAPILLIGGCIAFMRKNGRTAFLCLACFMIFFGIVHSFQDLEQYGIQKQQKAEDQAEEDKSETEQNNPQ